MTTPYLEMPCRSEAEVRRDQTAARLLRSEVAIATAFARALETAYAPTPTQRWLESIGPKLEQFRKEDEGKS